MSARNPATGRPTVYIETTVLSYLTSRPSRDVVVAGHQQVTLEWWEKRLPHFAACISEVVEDEAARGDPEAARHRLAKMKGLRRIDVTPDVVDLARYYHARLNLPRRAAADALHMAVATWHRMDYLLTWNMAHIANGRVVLQLHELDAARGLRTPVICTPEELLE